MIGSKICDCSSNLEFLKGGFVQIMLKITRRNSLKDHKKIKQFSSIVKDKLNSESRNTKKINTFTFEELSDLNKILTISDFILAKYEHKKNVHSILNEFVDLIKETENSIISMDDEIEELTLSANVPINHIMEIKNRISKKHGLDLEEYTKYEGDAENSSNNLTTSSIDVNS